MAGRRLMTTEQIIAIAVDPEAPVIDELRDWVDENGLYLSVYEVGEDVTEEIDTGIDTIGVTIGGDGTFLEGVRSFASHQIPILGVDLGTRAFLVRISPDELTDALDEVLHGQATIENRSRLRVRAGDLDVSGLNDVMLRHAPPSAPVDRKITTFEAFIDQEFVGRFEGTAILVSTPTGATGMALSAGGPVHYPRNNHSFQLTPVLIHDTSARSIVLDDKFPVFLRAEDEVEMTIDGGRHHCNLAEGSTIRVERAERDAEVIRTSVGAGHFETLSTRLGWHPRAGPTPPAPSPVVATSRETDFYSHALAVAEEAAKSVGPQLRNLHGKTESIEYKSDKTDIVTEADYQSERIITSILQEEFPDHSIHSEETVHHENGSEYMWMIDPLDGTGNYANGNPNYSVSIALIEDGHPMVGVVYAPETDELFSAIDGRPATRNGAEISTTDRVELSESVFMSGYDPDGTFLTHFYQVTRGVRRLGSAALHLCYLAAGSCDATWEYDTYPWDVAAGVVIARSAGARITNIHGDEFDVFGPMEEQNELLGSNGPLHPAVLEHLKTHDELGKL